MWPPELVGPGGRVVGVDANPQILNTASARARAAGLDHVSFVAGDCRDATLGGPFDAVVGRLVLMYLADPVDALRLLADRLGPGGIIAFQEFNFTPESLRPCPPTPLWQQSWSWIVETIRRAQIPAEVGFGLRRAFLNAGLPEPELRLESIVAGGPDSVGYEWMAETVRSMLPLIVMSGVATKAEIGIDTLASRLRRDHLGRRGRQGPRHGERLDAQTLAFLRFWMRREGRAKFAAVCDPELRVDAVLGVFRSSGVTERAAGRSRGWRALGGEWAAAWVGWHRRLGPDLGRSGPEATTTAGSLAARSTRSANIESAAVGGPKS